ncbi:MAG: T9SS type A sorting domain-containing protein [Flavobacteriales bacterium]|nr:T9SS type A sorting domain-containing protein [Flavobacteriales bacterium]MCB9190373.1 T9SS type A sorting domain-containing protein [Flavobacteriales bacterium]MCB9204621.1 T9SS type A sorting domain-containing protein [Flavobacteriales bacterium]
MRKLSTLLLSAGLFCTAAQAQLPLDGLVGQWTFDNGNANDEMGVVNGSVTNASLTTDRFGNADHAYQFSSSSTYIGLGNNFNQYISWAGPGIMSMSFWVNFDQVNGAGENQFLLVKSADGSCGETQRQFFIRLNSNNKIELVGYGSTGTSQYLGLEGSTFLTAGNWYHVVVTYNHSNAIQGAQYEAFEMYINGVQQNLYITVQAGGQIGSGLPPGLAHWGIGNMLNSQGALCSGSAPLKGKFDDLRFYSTMLSQSEVDALYAELDPEIPLVQIDFNDGTADDQSGYDNHGVASNTSTTSDRFGNPNAAYRFNGSTSVVELVDGLFLRPFQSVSLWFKTTDEGALLGYQNSTFPTVPANYAPIAHVGTNDALHATFWAGVPSNANGNTAAVNDGQWHHMVLASDPNYQRLYIDNQLVGNGNGIEILSSMTKSQLGAAYGGSGWGNIPQGVWFPYDGDLDDLYVFNRVLTASDVDELYMMGNQVTGIADDPQTAISIYPNPATDVVNIITDAAFSQLTVIDMAGRSVANFAGNGLKSIDMSRFDSGIYFLQFENNGEAISTQKIVIR